MGNSATGTEKINNLHFQQELIQQVLLESGVISPEHIKKAREIQRQFITEGKKDLKLQTYYLNQEKYSLIVKNPVTDSLIAEVQLPIKKKNKPDFAATDWYPFATSSVMIYADDDYSEVGELIWSPQETPGLTISGNISYLQIKGVEGSYYYPVLRKLHYESFPSEDVAALPLDLTCTINPRELYIVDRGGGILYIFDRENNRLSGAAHLRPPGSRKTLNVSSTADGKKIFATDNVTPGLYIIDSKSLKIKKQALPYGNLCNIISDENWMYILVDKPGGSPEIVVLDPQNLILRATIRLQGELFSTIDDPTDLVAISPSGKYLMVMTYSNYPSLFTPIVNVIDTRSFLLVDQIFLSEAGKPTYLSFAMEKPEELVKLNSSLLDIMINLGFISETDVEEALEKIRGSVTRKPEQEYSEEEMSFTEEESFGFIDEEEKQASDVSDISAQEKYPVLSQFEIDPSLLLAFKEEQMKYFSFLPVNKIDNKLKLAVANPSHKHTLKQLIETKFPDMEVEIIDFTLNEFNFFMKEFYAVIKEKYEAIIAKQIDSQVKNKFEETEKTESNKPVHQKEPPRQLKPLPQHVPLPKSDMPPNVSANVPSDVRLAVREKLKMLDHDIIDEAIMAICAEDFLNIWGVEVPKENLLKHKHIFQKARKEIFEQDYAFVKIENLVGQFALETVVNQEKLVVMLKTLTELAQNKYGPGGAPAQPNRPAAVDEITDKKCSRCNTDIPPEIDICSKCSREMDHQTQSEDIRSPASPNPLANLEQGHVLLADKARNRVVELNGSGQIIWQLGGKKEDSEQNELIFPHSASRLRSGTTLITDSENDRVIEYTKSGRIYWELKDREGFRDLYLRRPVQAIRLLNGNTLIVDQGNHRVFEVNHLDKIVWQYGTTASVGANQGRLYSPSYVQRLSNGHTLIADTDNHRIIEIDQDDEIVWQYGNPKNKLGSGYGSGRDQLNAPLFASKLNNGNVLIVDTGNNRILEVTTDKQVSWHFSTSVSQGSPINIIPQKAYRLENGHTVIFSADQIVEVSPEGQLIYIRQIEFLQKSPDFKEEVISQEKETIIRDRLYKQSVSDKAKQASTMYTRNATNLGELEVPLIDRANHKVFIANRFKNVIWRFGEAVEDSDNYLERPQHVELLKDEYVLIADTDNHRVIKVYRPTKEIVWQYGITGAMGSGNNQLGHPRSVTVTPQDNLLITDQYSSRVLEITMQKEVVWSFGGWDGGGNSPLNVPYYAERTADNTTLITDWSNHIVVEVDHSGNIIWQYGISKESGNGTNQLMYPEKAIRVGNGNTLIADSRNNRVIEVDRHGRIKWEFMNYKIGNSARKLSGPSNVFRLVSGNTVIVHNSNKNILEVNTRSEIVWQYQVPFEKR